MKALNLKILNAFLLFILISCLAGCKKTEEETPKKFEIVDINYSPSKVIVGQRIIINSVLSDSTGNIYYEWKLFYNNLQVGTTFAGLDLPKVKMNPSEIGEYTVRLTITRGETDKSTFELKFISNDSNFQYGVWGDNETTIGNAESDNGNEVYNALVGIPKVIPNNEGLTTLTYKKGNKYFTYYFKNAKLYAGAFTLTWDYVNQNTNLSPAYNAFSIEKLNLDKALNTTLEIREIWYITESSQIAHWDTDASTRAQAIGLGYLELKSEETTSLGRGSVDLNKVSSSIVLLEFILVSP